MEQGVDQTIFPPHAENKSQKVFLHENKRM